MLVPEVFCNSEIGTLRKVIVHRPDAGISRISPKDAEELLFDDIVYLPQMQAEHDIFTNVLKAFLGEENVLFIDKLLCEALNADEVRKAELIRMIVDYEELPSSYGHIFQEWTNEELAAVLISGYHAEDDHYFFDPIPNFIFTRDIAIVVKDHVVIAKAAKEARYRENILARYIFWAHPLFSSLQDEGKVINLNWRENFPPSKKGEWINLEGGDTMMFDNDFLLIGNSERTSEHAIHSLAKVVLEKGLVKRVAQVNIPSERYCMHIDTVFTRLNYNHMVVYKPLIYDGKSSDVIVFGLDGEKTTYPSLKDFILAEVNPDMQFIFSGRGESPYQEREQWTDGCNLVAIKPGVAIAYDRNPETEIAFREAGYSVIHATELLENFKSGKMRPEEVENTIITLPSNELSRARGGSHCMTLPVQRDQISNTNS
ncbi:MAG TPA: arginine deiminase family protein [Saprospiraceae bacterium]|nr:arginine deiminase family protein [Saprospiraceae bacterium]HQW56187.1 arginine deiminase family protein [Saprospiraceae bacterium]